MAQAHKQYLILKLIHFDTKLYNIYIVFMARLDLVVIYKVKGHKHYVGLCDIMWPLTTLGSCQAKNAYQNNKYGIETYGTLNKL